MDKDFELIRAEENEGLSDSTEDDTDDGLNLDLSGLPDYYNDYIEYNPELGQLVFGNSWEQWSAPEWLENGLRFPRPGSASQGRSDDGV